MIYFINTKNYLNCIEETLEIIGMNGSIPIDCGVITDISDSDNDDENEFKQIHNIN